MGGSWQGMLSNGLPDGILAVQDDGVPAAQSGAVVPAAQSDAVVHLEDSLETPYTEQNHDDISDFGDWRAYVADEVRKPAR